MVVGPQKTGKIHTLRHAHATQRLPLCVQVSTSEPFHVIPLTPLPLSEGGKEGGSYLLSSTHMLSPFEAWRYSTEIAMSPSFFFPHSVSIKETEKEGSLLKMFIPISDPHFCLCVIAGIVIATVLDER